MAAGPESRPAVERKSELDFDALIRDWDSYGLPVVPPGAELTILEQDRGVYENGVLVKPKSLVYVISGDGKSERRVVSGMGEPVHIAPADKTTGVAKDAETLPWKINRNFRLNIGQEPNEELVLTVACAREGRKALAQQFLPVGLEAEQWGFGSGGKIQDKAMTPRGAIAKLAWRYWNGQLGKPGADRRAIADRLEMITKSPYGLDTPRNLAVVRGLRSSTAKSNAKPGSYEAMIDGLVNFHSPKGWGGFDGFAKSSVEPNDYDQNYYRLWMAGFDAVPALMEHLADVRSTSAPVVYTFGVPETATYYRVCDIISDLLTGLSADELKSKRKYLQDEGVNIVDPAAAAAWWDSVKDLKEADYLIDNAVQARTVPFKMPQPAMSANMPEQSRKHWERIQKQQEKSRERSARESCAARDHIIQIIAAKYPNRMPELFERATSACPEASNWLLIRLMGRAKIPDERKLPALVRVATDGNPESRRTAVEQLLDARHPEAARLLEAGIDTIPRQWEGSEMQKQAQMWGRLAPKSDDAAVWNRLTRVAREAEPAQRIEILEAMICCSNQDPCVNRDRRIEFLGKFLDDAAVRELSEMDARQVFIAAHGQTHVSVRDVATSQLATLLDLEACCAWPQNEAEWAILRGRVSAALAKRGDRPAGK